MTTAPRYDRPEPSEFAPYYGRYIDTAPEGDLLQVLERQGAETIALIRGLPEAKGDFAYAPDKWTIKAVLVHLADAERVFAYRALRFARGDQTPLPGFEQNDWAPEARAEQRSLAEVSEELRAVRAATLALLRGLPPEAPTRQGTASGKEVSVRALAWIIAGHEAHHLRVLRERYL